MSTLTIGVLLFIGMLALMAVRVPIAIAMFVPGVVGYVGARPAGMPLLNAPQGRSCTPACRCTTCR
jgi:C4-dicarboxylate transporter DctM subunit